MEYKITHFDEETGQIIVKFLDVDSPVAVDVPVLNNKFIEGQELDSFIQAFFPIYSIQRKENLKSVLNSDSIKNLVTPEDQPLPTLQDKWLAIRNIRNNLLAFTDWTQLPDVPLSQEVKQNWAIYRQKLRDLTDTSNPDDVVFPDSPYDIGMGGA